jgi:choline kinase
MTGRPPLPQTSSSSSLPRKASNINLSGSEQLDSSSLDGSQTDAKKILSQVTEWLQQEKAKRSRKKKKGRTAEKERAPDEDDKEAERPNEEPEAEDSDFDLSSLEGILAGYIKSASSTPRLLPKASGLLSRKGSIAKKLKRNSVSVQSSDTEFFGDEVLVPNVEANLDNTKTLAYSGGAAETEGDGSDKAKKKDQKHWNTFKQEILRLTHTLRLKGWRLIPIEQGGELEVARLSGMNALSAPKLR